MSSSTSSSTPTFRRSRLRRPLLLAWASLLFAVLGLGAPAMAAAAPTATITVIGTTMSPYGALQVMSVSGFGANEALTFALDGTDVTDQLVTTTTDTTGSITVVLGNLHFPTPSGGSVGSHTLTATDASASHTASVALQVIPSPAPTPATVTRTVSQMTSTGVSVRFDGFLPGETVQFGMANQVSGSECGAPVTADASGSATATCVWNAAYVARFGLTPVAGAYTIGGNNSIFTIYSDGAVVNVVTDPVTAPPAATPPASTPIAKPAVPVKDRARFTG